MNAVLVNPAVTPDDFWLDHVAEDAKLERMEDAALLAPANCDEPRFELDGYPDEEWAAVESFLRRNGGGRELEEVALEIQEHLWLSFHYQKNGARRLARECAQACFDLWRDYHDLLEVTHGPKLRKTVVTHARNLGCPGATHYALS